MPCADIAVATITWARSPEEEAILATSLSSLAELGMPVAVAHREGGTDFVARLSRLSGFHVCAPAGQGLVSQIQASVATAATFGRPIVLYVEPDKRFFFSHRVRQFIEAAPDDDVGVVIAGRSSASFDTFPPMQRFTEGVINQLCAEIVGVSGDYSYGPFLLTRALLPRVAAVEPDVGWGWRHAVFVAAVRAQLDVVHVTGDYPCPSDQRDEDAAERAHRMMQLSESIRGLLG